MTRKAGTQETALQGSAAPGTAGKADRKARLAEELRANLARRKAQARSRRTGGADERPDGLGAAKDGAQADPGQAGPGQTGPGQGGCKTEPTKD